MGRPWNAAESSRRQTFKLSLALSESTKRSAEDILFAYLDRGERRIYNDLARRIQKRMEELESEKSKRRDRRSVKPLTNLMQE